MVTLEELEARVDAAGLPSETVDKIKDVLSADYESDFPELAAMTVDLYLKTYEEAKKENYDPVSETFSENTIEERKDSVRQLEREMKTAQLRFLVDTENTSGYTLIQRCYHVQELNKHMDEGVKLVASSLLGEAYPNDEAFEAARERVINRVINSELAKIRKIAEQGGVD